MFFPSLSLFSTNLFNTQLIGYLIVLLSDNLISGENVAPVPIEDAIKLQLKDIVSNCMVWLLPLLLLLLMLQVLGDKRKHLACILTLRTKLDSMNLPTNDLHPDVIEVRNANTNKMLN